MADNRIEDPEIGRLLVGARDAQQRGDLAAAARQLEEVLALEPGHPGALNSLGMLALSRDDPAAAEEWFARAAEADPEAPALWVNLAAARRRRGDDEGERKSLLRVLEIDQRHLTANLRLAELHERLGEAAQAMHRWTGIIALCQALPDRPPALNAALEHAQAFVAGQSGKFAEVVDRGLEPFRAEVGARDRHRFDACVDAMLGRRRIFFNECAGVHFPFLPAYEFFDRSHFPWMPEIEAQTEVIRAEFEALLSEGMEGFTPYVAMDPGTPTNKWSELDRSLDWSAFFLWRHAQRHEAACRRCPRTAEAVEALPLADMPRRAPTAFFSVLRPKTRLPAHSGVSNVRTVVHLPLIVPAGCGFRVGGELREWRVGEAFAFDDTIEHEAWNDSDELRAVFIFEVWNPYLTEIERQLLRAFFYLADTNGIDPSRTAVGE